MINETMLPREGLFDMALSVLAEIRHSTKFADVSSIRPASSKRLTEERKLYLHGTVLHSRYKREAENDLVVRHSQYSESNLDCMEMDQLLVCTC